ncbi:MAG: hypothetical protein QN229_07050 [Desulfurococcaceae archaeon TW002]
MNNKRKLIALLAIAALVSVVNASIFVYYPIILTISPQEPPVIFMEGSNAGKKDLWGNIITVEIEDEGTKLAITVHPTLQKNYYYDIVKVKNKDTDNPYYIKFRVLEPINDDRISKAYLIIGGVKIDLMSTELQPGVWIELSSGGILRVDLYLELTGYVGGDIIVEMDLIFTTALTTETPPTVPP